MKTTAILEDRRAALCVLTGAPLAAAALVAGTGFARAKMPPGEYAKMTAKAGLFTKTLAELALQRAKAAPVRTFAQLEIGEVKALEEIVAALGVQPPARLDAAHAAMIDELRGLDGMAFDRRFVEMQMLGHRKALEIQQPMAARAAVDVPVATAKVATESIKSHMATLEMIEAKLA